jgi:L-fucose isomerase-like protein
MIKPKIGICTVVVKGLNLGEDDCAGYQKELVDSVKKLGFNTVVAEKFISTPEIAEEVSILFNNEDVDTYILLIGTFTDDKRVMSLITETSKPVIIWAHDISAFNISITGAQNIMPNIYNLGIEYRFVYGNFDDKVALNDVYKFCRACAIKNKLSKTKIGYIGGHPSIMTCLSVDEIAVKKIFRITLVNFGNEDIIIGRQKIDKNESEKKWEEIKKLAGKVEASKENGLITSSTFIYVLKMVKEYSLDAVSINCFPNLKGQVCISISLLNDMGVPSACEGDLNSTILMYILYHLSGKAVANGDQLKVFNIDKPNNSLMFSHCGAGAFSLASNKGDITIHNDYETGKGIAVYFPERIPGEVTVANMLGSRDGYRMFITKGKVLDTDLMQYYEGNPMNIQFGFNIREMLKKVAYGGFGHHWNIGYGNYVEELIELCKLLKINYTVMV